MFTPHQSMHQFSPQRRQILGTGKRAGQQNKAFLGDEEASSVGPQKLFSDLKNTSGKQASGSNVFSKSPSRALGVKNTQSPQRSQEYPIKPSLQTESSKVDSASPVKAKSRARSQSPSKATRQVSPIRESYLPLSTTPLHNELDEGTSYLTTATPFPRFPQTPPADLHEQRSVQSFVTPASNVGEAGAIRLRKGEMFDALNQVQEEAQNYESEQMVESQEALEEEEYPEIEYMPPSVDIPYDFPPQLDGLPRAKELGECMAKMNMTGFYRPTSEERKQEVLADIFKFRPGKAEVLIEPRRQSADEEGMWPDITVSVPVKKSAVVGNRTVLAPSAQKSAATVTKKAPNGKGSANARPIIGIKGTNGSITRSSTTAPAKPRALGERDRNAIVKKKVMNPALRDFENDQMGKIIKAKLQENRSNETDGFIL